MLIWAAWMPATRIAALDAVAPVDVALLRYAVPALLLLPVWPAMLRAVKTAPVWSLIALIGWGAPFVLLVTLAMQRASVAHVAALVPCMMPLFALLFERVLFGTPLDRERRLGYALIGVAAWIVLGSVLFGSSETDLLSVAMLLCASAGWAAFTTAFRRSGMRIMEATAWVCVVSTLLLLLVKAVFGIGGMTDHGWRVLAFHAGAQGLLSGFVATIAYGFALGRLGNARGASFTVLVPVLATLLAFLWLGERPSWLDGIALASGTLGVAIVNGVLRLRG